MTMITQNWLTLSPAYGRDYKSKAEVEADFRSGKDFKMETLGQGGTYCSIRDFAKGTKVMVRYAKMRSVHQIDV